MALVFAGVGSGTVGRACGRRVTQPLDRSRHSYLDADRDSPRVALVTPRARRRFRGRRTGLRCAWPSFRAMLHDRFQLPLAEAGGVLALFGLGGLLVQPGRRAAVAPARGSGPRGCRRRRASRSRSWCWRRCRTGPGVCRPAWWPGLASTCCTTPCRHALPNCRQRARGTAVSLFVCALFLGQSAGSPRPHGSSAATRRFRGSPCRRRRCWRSAFTSARRLRAQLALREVA